MKKKAILTFVLALASIAGLQAQEVAVKTNVLYDATATINLGVEFGLAPKWSFDINGNYNDWTIRHHDWRHWMVQPEIRYWFCEKMQGNFVGAHLIGGHFNAANIPHTFNFLGNDLKELADHRVKGYGGGIGIAYGHAWTLAEHFNIEAEIGIGWIYTRYNKFDLRTGQEVTHHGTHNYVGPTKLALNLVYVF